MPNRGFALWVLAGAFKYVLKGILRTVLRIGNHIDNGSHNVSLEFLSSHNWWAISWYRSIYIDLKCFSNLILNQALVSLYDIKVFIPISFGSHCFEQQQFLLYN